MRPISIYELALIIIIISWPIGLIIDIRTGFAHFGVSSLLYCMIMLMIIQIRNARKSGKKLNKYDFVLPGKFQPVRGNYRFISILVGCGCLVFGIIELFIYSLIVKSPPSVILIALFPIFSGILILLHIIRFKEPLESTNELKIITEGEEVLISTEGVKLTLILSDLYCTFFIILMMFSLIGLSYIIGGFVVILLFLILPFGFLIGRFFEVYCLTENRVIFLANWEEGTDIYYKDMSHVRVIWSKGYVKYIYIFRIYPSRKYYTGEEVDYIYEDYKGDWGVVLNFSRLKDKTIGGKFLKYLIKRASLFEHKYLKDIFVYSGD